MRVAWNDRAYTLSLGSLGMIEATRKGNVPEIFKHSITCIKHQGLNLCYVMENTIPILNLLTSITDNFSPLGIVLLLLLYLTILAKNVLFL